MKALYKEKVGEYKIKIYQDEDPENPREWSNLGTMICFSHNYNLGDKHGYKHDRYDNWEEMKEAIIKEEHVAIILPIYIYDHSGISISTTSFNDRWDSGQIGWIFISKEKILKEFDGTPRGISNDEIEKKLIAEVEIYDKYLSRECYRYELLSKKEILASCGGFFDMQDCIDDAKQSIL